MKLAILKYEVIFPMKTFIKVKFNFITLNEGTIQLL